MSRLRQLVFLREGKESVLSRFDISQGSRCIMLFDEIEPRGETKWVASKLGSKVPIIPYKISIDEDNPNNLNNMNQKMKKKYMYRTAKIEIKSFQGNKEDVPIIHLQNKSIETDIDQQCGEVDYNEDYDYASNIDFNDIEISDESIFELEGIEMV